MWAVLGAMNFFLLIVVWHTAYNEGRKKGYEAGVKENSKFCTDLVKTSCCPECNKRFGETVQERLEELGLKLP